MAKKKKNEKKKNTCFPYKGNRRKIPRRFVPSKGLEEEHRKD